jgi:hypothetical protein
LREEESDLRRIFAEKTGTALIVDPICLKLLSYDPQKGVGEIVETNSNIVFTFSFS